MRRAFFFAFFIGALFSAAEATYGQTVIEKFEISEPADGRYTPWRYGDERPYAGELITISGSSFRYKTFSDVITGNPEPDYSGVVKKFEERIVLDHPKMAYPFRVSGLADGRSVLLTWRGYREWKKSKRVDSRDILYLENPAKKQAGP
jgi:hypothetical protein